MAEARVGPRAQAGQHEIVEKWARTESKTEMETVAGWFFGLLAVASGCLVVWNPFSTELVVRVLMFAMSMAGVAGLFLVMGAEYLALAQVLVYGAAVVALIVFAMMFGNDAAKRRPVPRSMPRLVAAVIGVALVVTGLISALVGARGLRPDAPGSATAGVNTAELGRLMLGTWFVPTMIVGVMLLIGLVGVALYCLERDTES